MTKREKIEQVLENLTESETIEMWNDYCELNRYDDRVIWYMGTVLEELNQMTFGDAMGSIDKDEFDLDDDYARNDDLYGWQSFCDIYDVVDDSELADYIEDFDESFGNWELEEIFEEEEEEEEEEE